MVLNEAVAANACRNQKNLSPNQPVNFKYLKREYKDSNRSFQLRTKGQCNLLRMLACSSASYAAKYENR